MSGKMTKEDSQRIQSSQVGFHPYVALFHPSFADDCRLGYASQRVAMTLGPIRSLPGHSQLVISINQALKRVLGAPLAAAAALAPALAPKLKERNKRYIN